MAEGIACGICDERCQGRFERALIDGRLALLGGSDGIRQCTGVAAIRATPDRIDPDSAHREDAAGAACSQAADRAVKGHGQRDLVAKPVASVGQRGARWAAGAEHGGDPVDHQGVSGRAGNAVARRIKQSNQDLTACSQTRQLCGGGGEVHAGFSRANQAVRAHQRAVHVKLGPPPSGLARRDVGPQLQLGVAAIERVGHHRAARRGQGDVGGGTGCGGVQHKAGSSL